MVEVTITVAKNGSATVAVAGLKGHGCKSLTAAFEKSLGKTIEDKPTKEMYEQESVHIRSRV